MILDHYSDRSGNQTSYLIACPETREAALINPLSECVSAFQSTLAQRNLRLVRILQTQANPTASRAVEQLREGRDNLSLFPARANRSTPCAAETERLYVPQQALSSDETIALGKLRITASPAAANSGDDISYRVDDYTFTSRSLLIAEPGASEDGVESVAALGQHFSSSAGLRRRVRNFRTSRDNVSIEQLLLEDLHTSLIEDSFSPKETLVVRAYIELLEENEFAHPSAADLADKTGGIERSVIHVLVHSIRWKQIDVGRLPLVLAGQASKWLRDLKTEPDFTPHEKEFLCTYLRLVANTGNPPSGPDVARELGSHRSIQWVRKRAFTIRRKQREFDQPLLMLARNKPELEAMPRPVSIAPHRNEFVFDQLPIA